MPTAKLALCDGDAAEILGSRPHGLHPRSREQGELLRGRHQPVGDLILELDGVRRRLARAPHPPLRARVDGAPADHGLGDSRRYGHCRRPDHTRGSAAAAEDVVVEAQVSDAQCVGDDGSLHGVTDPVAGDAVQITDREPPRRRGQRGSRAAPGSRC